MKRIGIAAAALALAASVACSSAPVTEVAESASAHVDDPAELSFFQAVRGRIDADQSVTYAFRGQRGWTVDVLAATPDRKLAWSAPSVVVIDETTGATLLDESDSLPVQGQSGHTIELPSTGRYTVALTPYTSGIADEAFTLQLEAQIACGEGAACPASLTCQAGRCWPAGLGPQHCDANGVGAGCVPAGHSECDAVPRQTCQLNAFVCGRTGGTETPSSCLGTATNGVCCLK
jgi:hypothetical protein